MEEYSQEAFCTKGAELFPNPLEVHTKAPTHSYHKLGLEASEEDSHPSVRAIRILRTLEHTEAAAEELAEGANKEAFHNWQAEVKAAKLVADKLELAAISEATVIKKMAVPEVE